MNVVKRWLAQVKTQHLRWLVHGAAGLALGALIFQAVTGGLGFNPIEAATLRTGELGIQFLWLSLACTPISLIFGYKKVLAVRKSLGLYAFFFVSLHFLIFVALDYQLDPVLLREAIFEKQYALIGFMAFVILAILAATSTKWAMRQLKKRWKPLHQTVYVAGILAALHYLWLVKQNYTEPIIYTVVLVVLLAVRVSPIRRAIVARQKNRQQTAEHTPPAKF